MLKIFLESESCLPPPPSPGSQQSTDHCPPSAQTSSETLSRTLSTQRGRLSLRSMSSMHSSARVSAVAACFASPPHAANARCPAALSRTNPLWLRSLRYRARVSARQLGPSSLAPPSSPTLCLSSAGTCLVFVSSCRRPVPVASRPDVTCCTRHTLGHALSRLSARTGIELCIAAELSWNIAQSCPARRTLTKTETARVASPT